MKGSERTAREREWRVRENSEREDESIELAEQGDNRDKQGQKANGTN